MYDKEGFTFQDRFDMYTKDVREASFYMKNSYQKENEDFIMRNARHLAAKANLKNEIDVYLP